MQMDYSDVIERVIAMPMALTWEAGPCAPSQVVAGEQEDGRGEGEREM